MVVKFRCFLVGFFAIATALQGATPLDEPRHFFGICWDENSSNILRFAHQMGYGYVFYKPQMEKDPAAHDTHFIFETPQYKVCYKLGIARSIDTTKQYSQAEQETYRSYFVTKSTQPFPHNMATGWFSSTNTFSVIPDFQQQRVIDFFVDAIIDEVKSKERKDRSFTFGGFAWDVPQLNGDFWSGLAGRGRQVTLTHWNATASSILVPGTTHEYALYPDGVAAFYKKLKARTLALWPHAIFIVEPDGIAAYWRDEIQNRPDRDLLMLRTMVTSEMGGADFADAQVLGGFIPRDWTGSTTPNMHSHRDNLSIAGAAGVNGSWFSWYGRFSGSGDWPNAEEHNEFSEIPHRLLLIRAMTGWDNLVGVPLTERSYTNGVYRSANSYADDKIIYSRHPISGRIFTVFISPTGKVVLRKGEEVDRIYGVDALFIETTDATAAFNINGTEITIKNQPDVEKGFVIVLKSPSIPQSAPQ